MPEITHTFDVHRVVDGDTIVMQGAHGGTIKVRVWGIDAPETDQPYGRKATAAARELVGGGEADVQVVEEGRYGRLIGRVQAGGTDVGRSLVRSGFAWHDRQHAAGAGELRRLQQQARREGRGLWSQDDPTPPWEHRDDSEKEADEVDVVDAARTGWSIGRWIWRLLP